MATDLSNQNDGEPISAINVTPFVDVSLVLLVIFMITAPTLMKDVIGIQLPKTSASTSQKAPVSLAVAITRQGQILLNGQSVGAQELKDAVRSGLSSNSELQGIISADQDARHGDVVHVIDLIKSAGLQRFAIQIEHATDP